MANMVGQIGCVTAVVAIVIIAIAFGTGWWLDNLMGNERRIMTVLFMLGSFPVTLFAMIRISLAMVGRAQERVKSIERKQEEKKEDTTI